MYSTHFSSSSPCSSSLLSSPSADSFSQKTVLESGRGKWIKQNCTSNPQTKLQEGPNGHLVLPSTLQRQTTFICNLTHWNPDKMIQRGRQYCWWLSPALAPQLYKLCNIYPQYNPGELLKLPPGQFSPLGSLNHVTTWFHLVATIPQIKCCSSNGRWCILIEVSLPPVNKQQPWWWPKCCLRKTIPL